MKNPPRNFRPEPYHYHQEVEITIEGLNHLGAGVGRDEGWVIFVPYTLPKERVRVKVWRNKKNYSDADLVEILDPSPQRIDPVCKLFGRCGGCQFQHWTYEGQKEWIQNRVKELFLRLADLKVDPLPCIGSPKVYHYRSKVTPHFRKPPDQAGVSIGFQMHDSRAIIDVDECPIASETINEELNPKRAELRAGSPKFKRGGTLLLRDSSEGVITDMRAIARENIEGFQFDFVAGEFFQNNPHILPQLVGYALNESRGEGIEFLADVYCGVGVFGICGHEKFKKIVGIEVNERAILLAQKNKELNSVNNISFYGGKAEAIFDNLDFPPEETAFIIDPPRKGCDESFIEQACAFGPARIVYVSCGPDTQARDAKMFVEKGYRIEKVQPFDLFPQTRHIENVITLVRD